MENDRGELVDLYVPRKCSATGRLIKATDHASVQISVARLDENGRQIPGENHVYALSGFVRAMGESDDAFNRITQKDGLLKSVWSATDRGFLVGGDGVHGKFVVRSTWQDTWYLQLSR